MHDEREIYALDWQELCAQYQRELWEIMHIGLVVITQDQREYFGIMNLLSKRTMEYCVPNTRGNDSPKTRRNYGNYAPRIRECYSM